MHESTTFWQRFVADRGGVLIVGHGTRNREGTLQFLQLASQIQDRLQNIPCQACFLELADPSIEEGVRQLTLLGVERLLVVPVLLFSAGHAKSDIPDAVAIACEKLGVQAVAQSAPLGTHPSLLKLSKARFDDARPPNVSPNEIELVMIGRGASDPTAVNQMLELTEIRQRESEVAWAGTGFFAVAKPTVREILEQAKDSPFGCILIQPHLLFEGELMQTLREMRDQYQGEVFEKRWFLAEPLGADGRLADALVELAFDALTEVWEQFSPFPGR